MISFSFSLPPIVTVLITPGTVRGGRIASESIFSDTNVLNLVRTGERTATRIASEPRNLVAKYARTELRKASFAVRVSEPWNKLLAEQKNKISN